MFRLVILRTSLQIDIVSSAEATSELDMDHISNTELWQYLTIPVVAALIDGRQIGLP